MWWGAPWDFSQVRELTIFIDMEKKYETLGQLLVGGPSGHLDFVLRALRTLRPCDPHNDVVIG